MTQLKTITFIATMGLIALPLKAQPSLPQIQVEKPTVGQQVQDRVIKISGRLPDNTNNVDQILVTNHLDISFELPVTNNSFSGHMVVSMGENELEFIGFNTSDPDKVLTKMVIVRFKGMAAANPNRQNALIPSRIVYVLNWNTDGTDVDIYSKDPRNGTIYFSKKSVPPGWLDHDDVDGYGPEVVSYRDNEKFLVGDYKVDIHYYSGNLVTKYRLDVLLNEGNAMYGAIAYHYRSASSLQRGNSNEHGPQGSGTSRQNGILKVHCDVQNFCKVTFTNLKWEW